MHLHADAGGLTDKQHRASLELFQSDIAPVLRREIPDPPWRAGDRVPPADDTALPAAARQRHGEEVPHDQHPAAVLDLVPISSGSHRRRRRCATASTSPSRPSVSATPATGSPSTTSTPASPAPPRRRARPHRRRHLDDPARLRRGADGAPHRAVHRRGVRPARRACTPAASTSASAARAVVRASRRPPALAGARHRRRRSTAGHPNGLLIPPRFSYAHLLDVAPFRAAEDACCSSRARSRRTTPSRSTTSSRCSRGTYRSADGVEAHVVPGEGADAAGLDPRQQRRGERPGRRRRGPALRRELPRQPGHRARGGRRLPGRVPALGRARPRPTSASPPTWSSPSTEAPARELAAGYGPWVRSIRTGEGAIPFPTPEQARRPPWTDADRALVADRVDTQFVGTPRQVADQLERLRDATGADELIITTITHDHADRVRSYELLAGEWANR